MKYLLHTIILSLLLTSAASAQEVQTITVGSDTISYTEAFEDIDNATSYYNTDSLVLTAYDTDSNGDADVWVTYREDFTVAKEMRDSDGDGQPDIFFEFDAEENLVSSTGEGLKQYEAEEIAVPTEEDNTPLNEEIDYAGDLEDIKKLAGESGGWGTWIVALLVVGGGLYFWKRKK